MDFVWNRVTVSLAITAAALAALQVWWITSLMKRNQRRRLAEPLSAKAFRAELDKIFASAEQIP